MGQDNSTGTQAQSQVVEDPDLVANGNGFAMTMDGRNLLKEGWLTLFKSKKPGLFSTKPVPDKLLERAWVVLHHSSSKGPTLSFYQDNRRETKVMKREKIEVMAVKQITRMLAHPKHPHCFTLHFKGNKRIRFNADTDRDVVGWLQVMTDILGLQYKHEKVIWEYFDDGGLWQALPENDSFKIEAHFAEQSHNFHLGDPQAAFQYNLNSMSRLHPRTKHQHRIKRTPFIWDQPEVLHKKMSDLPAIWEWGDASMEEWHPFARDTNIQIEDMYDSGSQWAELTLCLPSPMPFLLDLHDMKLVNFRTAVRYSLRRVDNSANLQEAMTCPEARSPSPDDYEEPFQETTVSPLSPIYRSLQSTLQNLQIPRKNIKYKQMLGEGAFGEVHLAEVTCLPGCGDKPVEVAVKQLRLSDFIARHGQHSQQMEDFLREAKEMAKVDHHRVIQLKAVCTLDYPLLLIEEYMNFGDLLGVLKDSRPHMELVKQLNFAHHVSDGMDYLATELNCVHRDLAARNILVRQHEDGSMDGKVADFGLSRHLYSEMYKHQGTKPRPLPAKWMALESLMYFVFTSKSDVWSYGVLLWEIMTLGRTPYPGVENRELLEQIEEKGLKLSKPRPCPTEIFDVILDCTQHDPDDRPSFAQLKVQMLEYLKLAKDEKLECPTEDRGSTPISPTSKDSNTETTVSEDKATVTEPGPGQIKDDPADYEVATPTFKREGQVIEDRGPETVRPSQERGSPLHGNTPIPEPHSSSVHLSPGKATPTRTKPPKVSPKPKKNDRPSASNKTSSSGNSPKLWHSGKNAEVEGTELLSAVGGGVSGKAAPDVPLEGGAEGERKGSEKDGMMEVTGGHVYYLLDPIELDPGDIDLDLDHPKSLPRHHEKPLTNHVANDGAARDFRPEVRGLPPTRPRGGSSLHNSGASNSRT